MKTVFFDVPVTCNIPFTNTSKLYHDAGVLMLPESYTDDGAPVPDPSGPTILDGKEIRIRAAVEGAFRWICKHDPKL